MKHNKIIGIGAAACMLVLILDSRTALSGAVSGVELCIKTLIPSLFPFFVLSILLTNALAGQTISILKPIASVCKMPTGTESILAIGFLGGYPVGAQSVSGLYRKGHLTQSQAMRMLVFCNNAGPAFIFGFLSSFFTKSGNCWYLWLIQIVSALFVGFLLPVDSIGKNRILPVQKVSVTDVFAQSIKAMALVCGWVVFSRMILEFAHKWIWNNFPPFIQTVLCGICELSNGCIKLKEIQNEGLRFITASSLLSLGGICVMLQTSALSDGVSMNLYFPGKLLQCCISLLLSYILQMILPFASQITSFPLVITTGLIAIIIGSYLRHPKITVAFRELLLYNRSSNMKEVSSCCFAKK